MMRVICAPIEHALATWVKISLRFFSATSSFSTSMPTCSTSSQNYGEQEARGRERPDEGERKADRRREVGVVHVQYVRVSNSKESKLQQRGTCRSLGVVLYKASTPYMYERPLGLVQNGQTLAETAVQEKRAQAEGML